VPEVNVKVVDDPVEVTSDPSVYVPAPLSITKPGIGALLVVMVPPDVPTKLGLELVLDQIVSDLSVMSPCTLTPTAPANVMTASTPVLVKFRHTPATVVNVTVKAVVPVLLNAVKKTSSAEVGTLAPLGPPSEADQLAVLVPLHAPVPPTQYRSAIQISSCVSRSNLLFCLDF
jgi:hypothetical protein